MVGLRSVELNEWMGGDGRSLAVWGQRLREDHREVCCDFLSAVYMVMSSNVNVKNLKVAPR